MPKYTINIRQSVPMYKTIEVEADNLDHVASKLKEIGKKELDNLDDFYEEPISNRRADIILQENDIGEKDVFCLTYIPEHWR